MTIKGVWKTRNTNQPDKEQIVCERILYILVSSWLCSVYIQHAGDRIVETALDIAIKT